MHLSLHIPISLALELAYIRDNNGVFQKARTSFHQGNVFPHKVEAFSLLTAIIWFADQRYGNMVITSFSIIHLTLSMITFFWTANNNSISLTTLLWVLFEDKTIKSFISYLGHLDLSLVLKFFSTFLFVLIMLLLMKWVKPIPLKKKCILHSHFVFQTTFASKAHSLIPLFPFSPPI